MPRLFGGSVRDTVAQPILPTQVIRPIIPGVTRTVGQAKLPATMVRCRILLLLGLALFAAAADAQSDADLCEGTAIVTGTGAAIRAEGLSHALCDVLVKRSGDPVWLHDPRAEPMASRAADLLQDYLYLDRLSDLPKHDEQGTRDRPYDLIARFAPAKVDAALAELGDRPWLTPRPALLPRIMITDSRHGSFPLTADGDNDERHREALLAAGRRFGIHLVLEPLAAGNVDAAAPGTLIVTGTLRWRDADPGWAGTWQAEGRNWGIKGVSFDDAYRNLVLGAMAIASGHALPGAVP
jgi:hypothetical protein